MSEPASGTDGCGARLLPNLLVSFGGALLVVTAAGLMTFHAADENTEASRMVIHTHEVLDQLQNLRYSLSETTATVRAFLMVGDEQQLAARDAAFAQMGRSLDSLAMLTRDHAAQLTLIAQLRPEIVSWRAVHDASIAAFRRGGTAAVLQLAAQSPRPSPPPQRIDALLRQLESNERRLLDERMRIDAQRTQNLRSTMAIFLLCTLALLGFLFLRARRTAIARDRAETQVQLQHQFLESVLENLPHMVFVKDAKTLAFVRMNRAGEELLGVSRERLIGKSDFDFFSAPLAQSFTAKDREVLSGGQVHDIETEPLETPRGTRYLHTKKVPIRGADGSPAFLLGISEDVTERRAFEKRLLELNRRLEYNSLQLESANKELESFSYSVSHDLRAPMRAMDGYAGLIEEECDDMLNADSRRYLASIRANARKMGELIDDLLTFSRLGRQQMLPARTSTRAMVQSVLQELRSTDPHYRAEIVLHELPDCIGDDRLLQRVWVNLIDNALKYSHKAAQPRIDIRGERRDTELIFSVRDNGSGFDMRYYDKLFLVFQRLHSEADYPGTGVGLAIVHRIVSRHDGRVWAESIPDRGATFYFSLPVTPAAAAEDLHDS